MKLIEGFWAGEPCYIVGGGPSLSKFDWNLLRGGPVDLVNLPPKRNIIVVNRAWKDVPTADFFFTEDARCITELWGALPEWKAWKGTKVLHSLDPQYEAQALAVDPTLQVIRKKRSDKFWSRRFADGLSLSSNSGIGALNVAHILGADPIYLLGFDCRSDGHSMANYHDDYPESWQTSGGLADSFRSDFEHWAAPHVRDRVIVNLCDERFLSRIECWPKWDRDGFLKTGTPAWRMLPSRGR